MTLSRNPNSHMRATEIAGCIEAILKAIIVKIIADKIIQYGKVTYNWSKPSLNEYRNRAELVFHQIAVELGFESPSTFMIIIFSKTNVLIGFFIILLGILSSNAPKRPNPLFRFSNTWLMAYAVPKGLKAQPHRIPRPV